MHQNKKKASPPKNWRGKGNVREADKARPVFNARMKAVGWGCLIAVAVGGIFYSPKNVGGLAYPFEFLAKPTELVSCDGNVGGWYAAANDLPTNTTKETGYYHFFSAKSRPADYIAMNIHEIGRWK